MRVRPRIGARWRSRAGKAAAALLIGLLPAGTASASIDEGTYTVVNPQVLVDPAQTETDGSFVSCPSGQQIVAEGAFWHTGSGPDPANAATAGLGASSPTFDGLGMFSSGTNISTAKLRQSVLLCLPSSVIGATYADPPALVNSVPLGDEVVDGYVACPAGERVVSGGAFWHLPGQGPDPALAASAGVSASAPRHDGLAWYASGFVGDVPQDLVFTIVAHCLPSASFGAYTMLQADSAVFLEGGGNGGGYLACPPGQRVVTGGAFWHRQNQAPSADDAAGTWLSSSSPTTDGTGWYADGRDENHAFEQLTTRILCVTPKVSPPASGAQSASGPPPQDGPTGQRAAALKKCKKKFPKGSGKRKSCLKRAKKLPA